MKDEEFLYFSDRLELESIYRKWIMKNDLADSINNFMVFLIKNDLLDEKKSMEFLKTQRR